MKKTKRPENCWEFWNCSRDTRESCMAYQADSGKECWMIVGSISTKTKFCPKIDRDFKHCWECPWFLKMNPGFDK